MCERISWLRGRLILDHPHGQARRAGPTVSSGSAGRDRPPAFAVNSAAMSEANSVPPSGESITLADKKLNVPNRPVIPFVEGDGTGRDIWRASRRVFDAAVEKAYGGRRSVAWHEVLAGEKAFNQNGQWLPEETLAAFRRYLVGIKGPLTTPVGGGIRSLN